jgi:hypothetical protein
MQRFPDDLPDFYLSKTHVYLLNDARKRIKEGTESFVCGALSRAAFNANPSEFGGKDELTLQKFNIKKFINRAIEGRGYFHDWQQAHGIFVSHEQAVKDRVKWIKYILENAERVG